MENNANYKRARRALDRKISGICGLGLDDLPDTCLVADACETIAEMLDADEPMDVIRETLAEFAREILEEEGMDFDGFE